MADLLFGSLLLLLYVHHTPPYYYCFSTCCVRANGFESYENNASCYLAANYYLENFLTPVSPELYGCLSRRYAVLIFLDVAGLPMLSAEVIQVRRGYSRQTGIITVSVADRRCAWSPDPPRGQPTSAAAAGLFASLSRIAFTCSISYDCCKDA